jgi:hypothetical protein
MQQAVGSRPELARSHAAYARLLARWGRAAEAKTHITEAIDMFRGMDMLHDLADAEQVAVELN